MNVSLSNMLATGMWTAFLSVLAIIGIVVAGGLIVAVVGKAVLSLFSGDKSNTESGKVDEFGYTYNNSQADYVMQNEEKLQQTQTVSTEYTPQDDYAYALDVDEAVAKTEQEALNKELSSIDDEDDFFKDFAGDEDERFGDDDLMGMIDEISQDVLDEEEQNALQAQQAESEANKSMLDKYSIDSYFDENDSVDEDDVLIADTLTEEEQIVKEEANTEIDTVIDEETVNEINALKQQVREIMENMEDNRNQSETFNEQLINILNELKEANKKEVKTEQDAEREINELKQQLENSRAEMEQQFQEKMADKDAEMQMLLQEQMKASNEEIESLKAQLSLLLKKLGEGEEDADDAKEVEPVEEPEDEISVLRKEVKEMLNDMREQNDAKNNEFNAQLLEILNEMKEATLKQNEQIKIETAEEAVAEVDEWQEQLKLAEKDLRKQFKEEILHKDEEEKAELRAQMENYNEEISELKSQLSFLLNKFQSESESAKAENQALIDQLEAERKQRINLEQEKLEAEKAQLEQLERLRKENEELTDKLHTRINDEYSQLTDDEIDDLYSEAENIDYSAISKMNEEQINEKVKAGLESSKQEIDELKEQVSRLTSYIEERENALADRINVHEVRTVDFDVEQIKEFTAKEVEERVREKLIDSLAEIQLLKEELVNTKEEIEKQYKDQLADKDSGMEYDRVNQLQNSAEKIDDLNNQLKELTKNIQEEQRQIKKTSKQCVAELEDLREAKAEEAQAELEDAQMTVIGPKNNRIALIASNIEIAETVKNIDEETVKQLSEAELDEIINVRLQDSNNVIEALKQEIEQLKNDLIEKNEQIEKSQQTTLPVVRSPLFDVEMIKNITAQEVERKVQERLAEAMKEIDEMKKQLELSKQEIERQYKEEVVNNKAIQTELKDKLKMSAAEVIDLKEQLIDLTEQITLEHQEAKQNSEAIVEQLEFDRKEKEEIAKLQLTNGEENSSMAVATAEVTVIGPANNQVALITSGANISEDVENMDIPTIDIETVKKLAEEEIEEKVEQRMAASIIEIEELKKQILNLSIQIQEMKNDDDDNEDAKPVVFHYSTEEAYLERLAILEERLKNAKKELKINAKELNPLEKVNRTLERDKIKLRRKYAIAAKKKVALYGVNNYVDIDKEKAEKLKQELELLEGLKLSVSHCEEVMNANIDRYPILVHTNKILKENIANIESDIEALNIELKALRERNGSSNN